MVIMCCRKHPELFWVCKDIAVNADGSYNGSRSLFFQGRIKTPEEMNGPDSWPYTKQGTETVFVTECPCPISELIRVAEGT